MLPLVSSEVENIVCSQTSTCLTCWPWCYSVQPCHRMTSVTHDSLSSLPLQPTLPLLTHWQLLSHCVHLPSFCLLSVLCFIFYCSPPGPLFLFVFLLFCHLLSHIYLYSHLSPSLSLFLFICLSCLCVFSQTYPGGPWRVASDDSCISSRLRGHFRTAPLRLNSTVWAIETKRERDRG